MYCGSEVVTFDPAVELLARSHADAGVRHEEARDLREARRDVLAQGLQLGVLLRGHLSHIKRRH